jgi:hypothetical protein
LIQWRPSNRWSKPRMIDVSLIVAHMKRKKREWNKIFVVRIFSIIYDFVLLVLFSSLSCLVWFGWWANGPLPTLQFARKLSSKPQRTSAGLICYIRYNWRW